MSRQKRKPSSARFIWMLSAAIAVVLVSGGVLVANIFISEDEGKRRQMVQMVTLIKPPPPPPPIKERPPEPQMRKQEILEEKKEEAKEAARELDDKPAGDQLGLDAEGSAGSDAFGLLGKKGGRALLGGDHLTHLLRKYAWYTALIQEELRRRVRKYLDQNGGAPKGKLEAVVRIMMDESGGIAGFTILGSSGNHNMDEAVKLALTGAKLNERLPEGMPRTLKLKIISQG